MLVLGVVSVASAGVITMNLQISVNGNENPTDSLINLLPSQTAELDITAPQGWVYEGYSIYWALLVAPAVGTMTGGVVHIPPAPDASMMLDPDGWLPLYPLNGMWGVTGSIDSYGATSAPGGTYFDGIIFHCESANYNTVVQLWATPGDFVTFELLDQVTIHQIPEPATMFLLGLGGLLFRKRGK